MDDLRAAAEGRNRKTFNPLRLSSLTVDVGTINNKTEKTKRDIFQGYETIIRCFVNIWHTFDSSLINNVHILSSCRLCNLHRDLKSSPQHSTARHERLRTIWRWIIYELRCKKTKERGFNCLRSGGKGFCGVGIVARRSLYHQILSSLMRKSVWNINTTKLWHTLRSIFIAENCFK